MNTGCWLAGSVNCISFGISCADTSPTFYVLLSVRCKTIQCLTGHYFDLTARTSTALKRNRFISRSTLPRSNMSGKLLEVFASSAALQLYLVTLMQQILTRCTATSGTIS